ncbi:unnamed protein product [Caenorhabditis brenneri]
MSDQPSTSAAYYRDHRTISGSHPFAPGNESDGSESGNDEIVTKRRPPIRRISAKKVRSKGGQFVKKSISSDSENEEEKEGEMEPPAKKKMENKSKAATMMKSRQKLTEVERNRNKMLNRRKKA